MRGTLKTVLAIGLALLTAATAAARDDRKKPHALTTAGNSVVVEPDALSFKPRQEQRVTPQSDLRLPQAKTGRGRINTKSAEGIDVSHYQYEINWERLAQEENVSYVYIKATEGNNLLDEYYRRNLTEARRVGLSVGSYHFYRPNIDWREQLAFMTSVVRPEEQDLVPLIDIERASGAHFIADLKAFIEAVTKVYGRKPLLYTYQNFYNKHLQHHFKHYPWMIACYSGEKPVLLDDHPYMMWQYTASGQVKGIRGKVDRSCLMPGASLFQLQIP